MVAPHVLAWGMVMLDPFKELWRAVHGRTVSDQISGLVETSILKGWLEAWHKDRQELAALKEKKGKRS